MKIKTRIAYGLHKRTGKLYIIGDTVQAALAANMMVKEYEKMLEEINPQLTITYKTEWV